jgi:hypothetical protein
MRDCLKASVSSSPLVIFGHVVLVFLMSSWSFYGDRCIHKEACEKSVVTMFSNCKFQSNSSSNSDGSQLAWLNEKCGK